jgi:AraC-like DNA-binding protein
LIKAGELETLFQIYVQREGVVQHRCGSLTLTSEPGKGVIQSPGQNIYLKTFGSAQVLVVSIKQKAVEFELSRRLDREPDSPLEFLPVFHTTAGHGASLIRLLLFLCCELDAPDSLVEFAPHSVRHIEQGIIAALVEGLPHNYTGEMQDQVRRIPAAVVRRAEEFIIAHLKDPLNIGDIAAAAGVSARSLHRNFRRHRGYSPLEFLRLARLKRVRAELETGRSNITVTSVAMDYGFFHLGRFSHFYKRRYGESPCKTLQRYRGAL